MNGDDLGDMMQQLDDLGDMIHEQQDLRDASWRHSGALWPYSPIAAQCRPDAWGRKAGSGEERTLDHSPRHRSSSRRPIRSPSRRPCGTRL